MSTVQTREELMKLGLKVLIAQAEGLGFKYHFHKKDAIADYIIEHSPTSKEVVKKSDAPAKKKADKKAPKEAPVVEVVPSHNTEEIPTSEEVEAAEESFEEEVPEVSAEPVVVPAKSGKKGEGRKKRGAVSGEAIAESGRVSATTAAEIDELRQRPDIIEILDLKTKSGDHETKSEKVRRLHFRAKVTIGQAAKLLGIHYSFAFCVVDAFRKLHEGKGDAK